MYPFLCLIICLLDAFFPSFLIALFRPHGPGSMQPSNSYLDPKHCYQQTTLDRRARSWAWIQCWRSFCLRLLRKQNWDSTKSIWSIWRGDQTGMACCSLYSLNIPIVFFMFFTNVPAPHFMLYRYRNQSSIREYVLIMFLSESVFLFCILDLH
jgi:hypothetical protein